MTRRDEPQLVPLLVSFPDNSQNALNVVKFSESLSRIHSAAAPTKKTKPALIGSVFGPTLMVPDPAVQMMILGPSIASNVALASLPLSSVLTTLNSSMGGS